VVGFLFAYAGQLFNMWMSGRLQTTMGFKARTHKPETPEGRIDAAAKKVEASFAEETVEEGMRQMRRYYDQEKMSCPNDKDLRLEVEQMLNASVQGDPALE
jgi:hypothetical protein